MDMGRVGRETHCHCLHLTSRHKPSHCLCSGPLHSCCCLGEFDFILHVPRAWGNTLLHLQRQRSTAGCILWATPSCLTRQADGTSLSVMDGLLSPSNFFHPVH